MHLAFQTPFTLIKSKSFHTSDLNFLLLPTGTLSSTSTTSVLPTVAESVVGAAEPATAGGVADSDARRGRLGGQEPTD